MTCPNCGNENISTPFCTACGTKLPTEAPESTAFSPEPQPSYPSSYDSQPSYPSYDSQPSYHSPTSAPYGAAPQSPYQASPRVTPDMLPAQYRPLSAWAYFGLQLLFAIPIVGFVFLIVFSFSSGNINRRSFARSYWCSLLVFGIIFLVLMLVAGAAFSRLF